MVCEVMEGGVKAGCAGAQHTEVNSHACRQEEDPEEDCHRRSEGVRTGHQDQLDEEAFLLPCNGEEEEQDDKGYLLQSCSETYPRKDEHANFQWDSLASD